MSILTQILPLDEEHTLSKNELCFHRENNSNTAITSRTTFTSEDHLEQHVRSDVLTYSSRWARQSLPDHVIPDSKM